MAAEWMSARACRRGRRSCLLAEEMAAPRLWSRVELEQGERKPPGVLKPRVEVC